MDETEHAEWQLKRYENWQHTAFLSALIANIFRDPKDKPYRPEEFMPVTLPGQEKPQKKQTWEDMLGIMQDLQIALGGEK